MFAALQSSHRVDVERPAFESSNACKLSAPQRIREGVLASRDPERPNVLFIISDDQGAWALGCAGNPEIKTPVLDRLAASGIRFENFFCTSPVCSPARASLLTGDIPSRHGVQDWIRAGSMGDSRIDYLEGQRLITDVFADAGYRCGLIGKWHLGASDRPRSNFVKWFAHQSGMGPYYDAPMVDGDRPIVLSGYITEELGKQAVAFVAEEAERPEPFWLSLNFTAPHYPWINSHPREFTDIYEDCPFESCPEEPPHPDFAGGHAAVEKGTEQRRESLAGYFASVTAMDAVIGKVIAELERRDLTRSTLVVFMSDNGMNCGHHGIWGKGNGTRPQNMYDTSIKVPCIMSQPGRIPGDLVSDDLLSGYDVYPTLVEFAGVSEEAVSHSAKPGRSFAALLCGTKIAGDRDVVVYDEYGPVRMVRTREWKYVHRYPDGPHELFDLVADPGERANRIADPILGDIVSTLSNQLMRWFAAYVDPRRDAVEKGVTGCGQLGRPEDATATRPMFADRHLNGADWDLWLSDGNPAPQAPE
ncbi:sulfatase-like hydrolase/transferase [Mesorhizobium sp. 1B3]|uniref:sulfatase-like hydrolase/transferase n=1 Tax=Mesorhizobium sp. 1B3 TaxID=3243599 RepID=UPI003D9766E0